MCLCCAEPTSVWQQCLDAETQCYYYWNYDTNDVTWEIPAEFSQYLLLYQQYEREYADWKRSRRKHRHSSRKSVSHTHVHVLVLVLVLVLASLVLVLVLVLRRLEEVTA